jgi:hypothetical protein
VPGAEACYSFAAMFRPIMFRRLETAFILFLLLDLLSGLAAAQIKFELVTPDAIQARLKDFSTNNNEREAILKRMFAQSGCKPDNLTEQSVKKKVPPNLICILPGKTDHVILVGAHTDHADVGDGVVDNWSGASLLPSLFYSLNANPRQHTFMFGIYRRGNGNAGV